MDMEVLTPLWKYAPLLGTIVLLVVVALVLGRLVRSRRSSVSALDGASPAPPEIDAELLDSSHIGFAPLVGSLTLPARGEHDAGGGKRA